MNAPSPRRSRPTVRSRHGACRRWCTPRWCWPASPPRRCAGGLRPQRSHAQGGGHAGGPPPAAVAVMAVAASNLAMNYEYVGQTAGSRDVEVRARVAGILLKRNFTEGGNVKRGQSLYSARPGAVPGGAQPRRCRRGLGRGQAGDGHAHAGAPEAAVGGARGEPARIRRCRVGRAGGARRPQGRAGAPRRSGAEPGLHARRVAAVGRGGPLAGVRGHAGRRPRHAADHADADRPDQGALRHRRHRPDEVAQRGGRRAS